MSDNASKPIFGVQHQALLSARVRRWSPGSLLGLLRIVGRRLWSHLWLMLAIAAGFVVAIALVVAIPVYAEAVGYRVLRDELTKIDTGGTRATICIYVSLPWLAAWRDRRDRYAKLNAYMNNDLSRQLGLPVLRRCAMSLPTSCRCCRPAGRVAAAMGQSGVRQRDRSAYRCGGRRVPQG